MVGLWVGLLNTDLGYRDISSEVTILFPGTPCIAYIENGTVFISSSVMKNTPTELTSLFSLPSKYAPRTTTYTTISVAVNRNDILNKVLSIGIKENGTAYVWLDAALNAGEPFTIQYPLKRS